MKNILIIGNGNDLWMKRYVSQVFDERRHKVYILNVEKALNEENISFYENHNIGLLLDDWYEKYLLVPKVGVIVLALCIKKIIKKYSIDIIHIHYVRRKSIRAIKYSRKSAPRSIVSFWGSDLLRRSPKRLKSYKKYFDLADYITLSSETLLHKFKDTYGEQYDDKIRRTLFGANGFESIDKYRDNNDNLEYFSLPHDRTKVTIGYNGSIGQQHIKVLDCIVKLDKAIRSKLFLIFPMSYGRNDKTVNKIKEYMKEIPEVRYLIIDKYLSDDEIGRLRLSTDIFIHAQITDSLSASVIEYLYAEKIVINPKWIEYRELKEKGISYIEYESFIELKDILERTLNDTEPEQMKYFSNYRKLYDNYSWSVAKKGWLKLYE